MKEKILTAITTYIQQHGYPPTVREIGEAVGGNDILVKIEMWQMDKLGVIELGNGPRAIRVPGWRFERIKKPDEEGTMRNATPEEQAAVRERRKMYAQNPKRQAPPCERQGPQAWTDGIRNREIPG